MLDGVPVAPVDRMAFDLAARQRPPAAVAHLDAVVRAGLVTPRRWVTGSRDGGTAEYERCDVRLQLVDARAESLPESQTRVVLIEAGFDVVPQFVVRRNGSAVARVDLAIAELRIAIEYDGAWHALREQLQRDRAASQRADRRGLDRGPRHCSDAGATRSRLVAAVDGGGAGAQRASPTSTVAQTSCAVLGRGPT